jgi:YfiR/HmsC-like
MAFLSSGPRRAPSSYGLLAASLAVACLAVAHAPAQGQAGEYELKAAFLFNFTKFVEWPARAFDDADQPITLCVVGEDPFGATLDDLVRGESVGERRISVRRLDRHDDLRRCHVLFVARSQGVHVAQILGSVEDRDVLTVGETPGFLEAGGLLRFVLAGSKVRFEINRQAIADSPLTISSKLQRLAVNSGEGGPEGVR